MWSRDETQHEAVLHESPSRLASRHYSILWGFNNLSIFSRVENQLHWKENLPVKPRFFTHNLNFADRWSLFLTSPGNRVAGPGKNCFWISWS